MFVLLIACHCVVDALIDSNPPSSLSARPRSGSSDLLVPEAGISFVFVLGINLSPVLDSACSQGEVIVIINVACPLSSAD